MILEKERKLLEDEYMKMRDDVRKAEMLKKEKKQNREKITQIRTGIKLRLVKIKGFETYKSFRVQYGLFVENQPMFDDLGDPLVYETVDYPASVIFDDSERLKWEKKGVPPRGPKCNKVF